jgi:hypothetical protein
VEFGPDGVAEWSGEHREVFVPRREILAIELRRGIAGDRLVVPLGVGFVVGYWAGYVGRGGMGPLAAVVPVAILVAYVVVLGMWPGYRLRVRTRHGSRTIAFSGAIDLRSLAQTLRRAHEQFGYSVSWAVPSHSVGYGRHPRG